MAACTLELLLGEWPDSSSLAKQRRIRVALHLEAFFQAAFVRQVIQFLWQLCTNCSPSENSVWLFVTQFPPETRITLKG